MLFSNFNRDCFSWLIVQERAWIWTDIEAVAKDIALRLLHENDKLKPSMNDGVSS
jgi:hypothetical protein